MGIIWGFVLALLTLGGLSCNMEPPIGQVGPTGLAFSEDTIKFDSLFANFLSETEWLTVYNRSGRRLTIDRIYLVGGENSDFDLIIDGIKSIDESGIVMERGDSLRIFANVKSDLRDEVAMDLIRFEADGESDEVQVQAKIIDANLVRSRFIRGFFGNPNSLEGYFIRSGVDTVWTPEKPIVVDGPLIVDEGATLTILPGTQVFFTSYRVQTDLNPAPPDTFDFLSSILVLGTLQAEGTPDQPITFQSFRFDSNYVERVAQWRGLGFYASSFNNRLAHCTIKNGTIGIYVDSLPTISGFFGTPKLTVRNTEIRNMGFVGVYAQGRPGGGFSLDDRPTLLMENSIVHSCKEATVFLQAAGRHEFFNCTFGNYPNGVASTGGPQVVVSAIGPSPDFNQLSEYPGWACLYRFTNCAFGSLEENDVAFGGPYFVPIDSLRIQNCLLNVKEDSIPIITDLAVNSILNQNANFNNTFQNDFRPLESSPLINAGLTFADINQFPFYEIDFRGRADSMRTAPYDIGAYEFFPLE